MIQKSRLSRGRARHRLLISTSQCDRALGSFLRFECRTSWRPLKCSCPVTVPPLVFHTVKGDFQVTEATETTSGELAQVLGAIKAFVEHEVVPLEKEHQELLENSRLT